MYKHRVILSTDIGSDVDDALALWYCIKHPQIKLEAVVTVYGKVNLRAKIAQRMLDLAGYDAKVAPGFSYTRTKGKEIWHTGVEGYGILSKEEIEKSEKDATDIAVGVGILYKEILENPKEIDLISIGPLTNIAAHVHTKVIENIKHLYLMGGAIKYPHELNENNLYEHHPLPEPEHNIRCDPDAARDVFDSSLPITLVPLDITRKVLLDEADINLMRARNTELSNAVVSMLDYWLDYRSQQERKKITSTALNDPLAVGVMLNPDIVKMKKAKIKVDTEGRTLVESKEGNVNVCYDVNVQAFKEDFLSKVLR
ncbi:MAG: nucleoside hydrolase [Candidatus Aenigmarchaeota archaeon]|nr:nucleoside hydrolase [Candidatus Aenigmarchaeota archaeon]